jgi:hypothetical protein
MLSGGSTRVVGGAQPQALRQITIPTMASALRMRPISGIIGCPQPPLLSSDPSVAKRSDIGIVEPKLWPPWSRVSIPSRAPDFQPGNRAGCSLFPRLHPPYMEWQQCTPSRGQSAMHIIRIALTAAVLAAFGVQASAQAQQKQQQDRRRPPVIINDPSLSRPPPMPPDRPYVGPAPSISPPMERIQPPAPLTPSPRP